MLHAQTAQCIMCLNEAERELLFAGFIAFECLVRKDSGLVVGALQESDHKARPEWPTTRVKTSGRDVHQK